MVRTQIQLTKQMQTELRAASRATGRSMADLIREGIAIVVKQRKGISREEQWERASRIIGKYSSGLHDVSTRHDHYLAEAYGEYRLR